MRRITVIGMIILGLVALPLVAAAKPEAKPAKIEICHSTGDGSHTIEVAAKALDGHLGHGDTEGGCADVDTTELPALKASFVIVTIECEEGFYGVPCTLKLDASGSEGAPAGYEWMYFDGTAGGTAYGQMPSIENLRKGTNTAVSLTIVDDDGAEDSVSMTILMFDTP